MLWYVPSGLLRHSWFLPLDTVEAKAKGLLGPWWDISARWLWKCLKFVSNFDAGDAIFGVIRMISGFQDFCLHNRIYEATLGYPYFLHCHAPFLDYGTSLGDVSSATHYRGRNLVSPYPIASLKPETFCYFIGYTRTRRKCNIRPPR